MVKYIIENDLAVVKSAKIVESSDAFTPPSKNILSIIYILSESMQIIYQYMDGQYFKRDIVHYFSQCKNFGRLESVFYEFAVLDPKRFNIPEKVTEKSKLIRIFINFNFTSIESDIDRESCMKDFASFFRDSFSNYIATLTDNEILASTLVDSAFYNRGDGIFSENLTFIPDVELVFNPEDFDNQLEIFENEVIALTNNPNLIYNVMKDTDTKNFKIALLHPAEALKIMKSELQRYNPMIIALSTNKRIDLTELEDITKKVGKYHPEIYALTYAKLVPLMDKKKKNSVMHNS